MFICRARPAGWLPRVPVAGPSTPTYRTPPTARPTHHPGEQRVPQQQAILISCVQGAETTTEGDKTGKHRAQGQLHAGECHSIPFIMSGCHKMYE